MGDSSMVNDMDSPRSAAPTISKGTIVLTPTNYICRVRFVNLICNEEVASVEYLEFHGAYMEYKVSELTILAPSAKQPFFDAICAEKHSYEREQYLAQAKLVDEHVKTKGVTRCKAPKEKDPLTERLKQLSPEQLAELLKELEKI